MSWKERTGAIKAFYEQCGKDDAEQLDNDLREVMSTGAGRRLLMAVLGKARVFGSIYAEANNPTDLAYLTGRRELGCELYAAVNRVVPEVVTLAIKERNDVMKERHEREILIAKGSEETK